MSVPTGKRFDLIALTANALQYVRHFRLMTAMACIGILAGLVYFVYGTPIYQAKSLVYLRGFGAPLKSREVRETFEAGGLTRQTVAEFTSRRNQIETARRMGLIGKASTWEDLLTIIPSVRASIVDSSHLEVTVLAKDPSVVRAFCEALVSEFRIQQEQTWSQYRDEALERYATELGLLERKADEGLSKLANFERDGKMTESTIEQSRLNDLPRDLVVTKEILLRMNDLRKKLDSLPSDPASELGLPEVLEELSLLTVFEKEREVKVGDMVRKDPSGGSSPVNIIDKPRTTTEVIVQPGMVESLNSWQTLEKDRRILEDRFKELEKQFQPGHRVIKELNEELDANERALRAELAVLRQRFVLEEKHFASKLSALESRLPEYQKVNEEVSRSSQAYADIEKNKELWDKARDRLADKVAVIAFSEDRDWVEMRFKGHTSLRDQIPVSPNKMRLLTISLVLALGGSFGLPTLVNMLNNSVHTLQQLEDATGAKGIGIIPHTTKEILEDVCRSPSIGSKVPNYLLENFRLVRSHILLHPGRTGKSQVVMVTSARPSEGKTSQAANLAWAFQSMGARTLLIDCDLRRGRLHHFTKVSNELGITHLLQGHCSLNEAILKTPSPLLDVIPRGPIVIGTTDLLVQPVFYQLITALRAHYDQIVVDTPPVLGLSETSGLQQVVDGVVFVVRAEKTSRKDVVDAITLLRKAGAHLYGMVLNDLDLSKSMNYYNYYYYSSTYYEELEDVAEDRPSQPAVVI